jgi:UDP-N-acetylmuramoylalanine-D-glutamate ligase
MADRGDTVLLSPASDKLMPYADYEAMGRDFKREVARL